MFRDNIETMNSSLCLFRNTVALGFLVCLAACQQGSEPANPPGPRADVPAIRAKAEQGDPVSQAQLGRLYMRGEGVTNSYPEAAKWFQRAAEKGNADAEAALGELYEAGQGVPQDMKKALEYYRMAAEKGNAGAQYTMGFLAECGRGVPQNQAEAAKWFLKAAAQGEPLSQYDLGQRYEKGVGVAVDLAESFKWFKLAADQKQADAILRLEQLRGRMSAAELAEGNKRVAAFRPVTTQPAPQ
jgi:TPR repeat protein